MINVKDEEELGRRMALLAKAEMQLARMKWGGNAMRSANTNREHFGRIKAAPKKVRALTNKAAMINKMLVKGMCANDICDVMDETPEYVTAAIKKYDLPRTESPET